MVALPCFGRKSQSLSRVYFVLLPLLSCLLFTSVQSFTTARLPRSTDFVLARKSMARRDESKVDTDAIVPATGNSRRSVLQKSLAFLAIPTGIFPTSASARGLVQFPAKNLINTYHFMRVGTTLLEEEDIWSTNPMLLTARDDALSPLGQEQVIAASKQLEELSPTVVKYSLAAACIDTANILGRELRIGRDRLVPEFTFMDPRAIGQWDMLNKTTTVPAVYAMDYYEAGPDGIGGRPPAGQDGTPNETLSDQAVRLRQILSILETQYSGDTIVLVFRDGTSPALMSCMIAGIPYNECHLLDYKPGEVRTQVTAESIQQLYASKLAQLQKESPTNPNSYQAVLEQGKKELEELRSKSNFVNIKDQKIEQERLSIEKEMQDKAKEQKRIKDAETAKFVARQEAIMNSRGNSGEIPPAALAVGAVGAVGAIGVMSNGSRGNSDNDRNQGLEVAVAGGSNAILGGSISANNTTSSFSSISTTAVPPSSISSKNLIAPSSRSTGGLYATAPPPTKADKAKLAEEKMKEYLEEDDGEEAWLQSIQQIISEEESFFDIDPNNGASSNSIEGSNGQQAKSTDSTSSSGEFQ